MSIIDPATKDMLLDLAALTRDGYNVIERLKGLADNLPAYLGHVKGDLYVRASNLEDEFKSILARVTTELASLKNAVTLKAINKILDTDPDDID